MRLALLLAHVVHGMWPCWRPTVSSSAVLTSSTTSVRTAGVITPRARSPCSPASAPGTGLIAAGTGCAWAPHRRRRCGARQEMTHACVTVVCSPGFGSPFPRPRGTVISPSGGPVAPAAPRPPTARTVRGQGGPDACSKEGATGRKDKSSSSWGCQGCNHWQQSGTCGNLCDTMNVDETDC